jgi:hypothetical protein
VAKSLGLSRARVARLERRALRTLRRKVRAGGCATPAPLVAAGSAPATVAVSAPVAPPAAPQDRGAVKGSHASGGSLLDLPSKVTAVLPNAVAEATTSAARNYADEHPTQFALAVLVTLLCALLLVRAVRRETHFR